MEKVVVGISGNIKELPARSGLPYDVVSRRLSDGSKKLGLPIIFQWGAQIWLKITLA